MQMIFLNVYSLVLQNNLEIDEVFQHDLFILGRERKPSK